LSVISCQFLIFDFCLLIFDFAFSMAHYPKDIKPWSRLDSETVYTCRIFSLRKDRNRSPRDGREHDFFVLDSGDWVNIIPVTPDDEVVLIHQYRHGIDDITLEIPGGMVDPHDPSPLHAARREMQEETGYDTDDVIPLGAIHPNPAIQGNRCHTFLARNVSKQFETNFDTTEETEVVLVPYRQIPDLVRQGRITHALVVTAFYWYELLRQAKL
jgi:8-oxo-dGTP pyrophosphatase MutT (NUDIX family)